MFSTSPFFVAEATSNSFIALKNSLVKGLPSHFFNYFDQKVRGCDPNKVILFTPQDLLMTTASEVKTNFLLQGNTVSLFSQNGYFCETVINKIFHLSCDSSINKFKK